MQQPEGDGVAPVHRQDLEQRMDIAPVLHRHQHAVVVFALVESIHAVKIKVHDLDLGMVFPQIVPQQVHIVAPVPAHQHQPLAVQVLYGQRFLLGQPVVDRHGAADGFPGDLQPGAPAQVEHGLVKDARHHIDALAEVGQDLTGVFGGVVKGDQLELDARVVLLHAGPQVDQELGRRHGGGADADHLGALLHGVFGPGDRVLAILDDVSGILTQGVARRRQLQAAVGADEQRHTQAVLQQVDLLDDRRGRDIQLLGSPVEAAGFCHTEKRFQLGVIDHPCHRPFLFIVGDAGRHVKKKRARPGSQAAPAGHKEERRRVRTSAPARRDR